LTIPAALAAYSYLFNKQGLLAYSFQIQKSTLLALIGGYFTGKQHQILPTRLLNLKKKFQPFCLFQPTRLLES
jgi:hypothetical protein